MADFEGCVDLFAKSNEDVTNYLYNLIDWSKILHAGVFFTHENLQTLERNQTAKRSSDGSNETIGEVLKMLLQLALHCSQDLRVQLYSLVRIEDILLANGKHAALCKDEKGRMILSPFLLALSSANFFLQRSASIGLACLLHELDMESSSSSSSSSSPPPPPHLPHQKDHPNASSCRAIAAAEQQLVSWIEAKLSSLSAGV